MNFNEYKKVIESTPETIGFEYKLAVAWLHPQHMPLCVTALNGSTDKVIKIPAMAVNRYGRRVPVTAIGYNAFKGNTNVTDIILSTEITTIGAGAFWGCTALERITIPQSVKIIYKDTFTDCDSLTDIYYEGTAEEWDKIDKYTEERQVEFGTLVPGSLVNEIKEEAIIRLNGNKALRNVNIHCRCKLS